ncbi:MAG: L-lysine 6-transaminase [Candidatus Sumerlaeia bacterium]|nr:L-lysine 6-transaminase [Candidatus Sumerlaeia bacterium]
MQQHIDTNPVVQAIRPHVTLIDQYPLVIDFARSQGSRLWDCNTDSFKIDFASSYSSIPLGYNHPIFHEPEFERELLETNRTKIANLDVLCEPYARFLDVFRRVAGPGFSRFFFIDGGALAVENALKTAFDWKVHRNLRLGKGERGTEIIHFREAFHGRSGYTLSVTNTADPNKTKFFPKFKWPRVTNPKCYFPLKGDNLDHTIQGEHASLAEIDQVLAERADDIAAILLEPIQGEGGDNHFRPEFLRALRERCDRHDVLLIFDEVQTGLGMTGHTWAWQGLGVKPDIVCFAKKAQTGGFMATDRILEEPHNVFTVPSRISSTWGSSLADMVRCRRFLEFYEESNLIDNVRARSEQIIEMLQTVAQETEQIHNVRGRGLFIAFDLVVPDQRNELLADLERRGLLCLPSGTKSVRFRPHLNVTEDVVEEAIALVRESLLVIHPAESAHNI